MKPGNPRTDRSRASSVSRGMGPNLSLEHLAFTLAMLGTGCSKASAPAETVHADQPSATVATSASASPQETPVATATATVTATASAVEADTKPKSAAPARPGGHAHGTGGQASCGAGTCSADIKKK